MFSTVLRLRTAGRLSIHGSDCGFELGQRHVTVSAPDTPIGFPDKYWLSIKASGFESEAEAIEFGTRLSEACQVSSVIHRLGLDVGTDDPSSPGFFIGGLKQVQVDQRILRGLYHGLDVYAENSHMQFVSNTSNGVYVPFPTEPFIAGIMRHFELHPKPVVIGSKNEPVLRLFNEALLQREPTSRTVLFVSIVEMLGQDQVWTSNQRTALNSLAAHARSSGMASTSEMEEVAVAIEKLHRLSLRQGVLRLLRKIGLECLSKPWDDLYEQRSKLVHANKPNQHACHAALAARATRVCGRILISALNSSLQPAPEDLERSYPLDI